MPSKRHQKILKVSWKSSTRSTSDSSYGGFWTSEKSTFL